MTKGAGTIHTMQTRVRMLGLCALFGLFSQGCASMRVAKVQAWEAEGNEQALKAALADDSESVQEAVITAWVHYGEYDTGRPSVLASLQSSPAAAARQAEKRLFGQPPKAVPDPFPEAGASSSTVIYFYREIEDAGAAHWIVLDDSEKVRLAPGRYFRYAAATGSHRACVKLPDAEAPLTDDPSDDGGRTRRVAPQCSMLSAHTAGVYFVRYRTKGSSGRPELKVMPVPPGLSAVKPLTAVAAEDRSK